MEFAKYFFGVNERRSTEGYTGFGIKGRKIYTKLLERVNPVNGRVVAFKTLWIGHMGCG